jgi:FkbM family methyltransferase
MTTDYDELCEYIEWNGDRLKWPIQDKKLKQVNDWVNDLNTTLLHMKKSDREMRVAVQAGGACGVWPLELAKHFAMVYTFEPDPVNYWCLCANVSHLPSTIAPMNMALGENKGVVETVLHHTEQDNSGAYYTRDSDAEWAVPRITIDSLNLGRCDLICLDIEGREVEALRGAYNTIERHMPFIMIEEKPLPQMGPGKPVPHQPGEATEWLQKIHGYKVVARIHRDVLLSP